VRDAVALVHLDRGKVRWRLGWLVDREVLVESGGDGFDWIGEKTRRAAGWFDADNKESGGGVGMGWMGQGP